MNPDEFKTLMSRARLLVGHYAAGFRHGLRRFYFGEQYGTPDEHKKWMSRGINDGHRTEFGRGYRDGFAGGPLSEDIGRPKLVQDERLSSHSIQLNDARWNKLNRLGTEWLKLAIDRAEEPGVKAGQ